MVLSKFVVSSSPHLVQGEKKVLLYSLLTNKLFLCNFADFIALKHNGVNYLDVRELQELGMVIDYSEKDNGRVCVENIEKSKGFPLLRIQIQPTYDCQLACSYCGQEHRNLYMNRKVEEGILVHIERVLSSGRYKGLSVGWFGGEPTMSEESMFRMTEEFRMLCKKMGLSYQAKLCTNGYQLSDRLVVNSIETLCLSEIQITLDGPNFINDRIKPTANGEGSYYRIMENMSRLVDIGANVRLRCNVNKENCNYVKQLIDDLCENKIEKKIHFYIRSVYYWGQDDLKHMLSSTEFAKLEIVIFRYMLHKGMKLNLLPKRVYRTCFAQDKDSFLVDPLGRLFNCDEVTPVPAYENLMNNRFQIGCIESGIDEDKRKVIGNFHDRILLGDYPCLYCKMYPVCAGLCHLRWLRGHRPCPSYKYNIKERLDLYYKYVYSKDFA